MLTYQILFGLFALSVPIVGLVVVVRLLWSACQALRVSRIKLAALCALAGVGLLGLLVAVAAVWFGYAVAHSQKDLWSDLQVALLTGLPFHGASYALWRWANHFQSGKGHASQPGGVPPNPGAGREEKGYDAMNSEIVIRSETKEDIAAITEVTIAAFRTLEISSHTEQFIIEALRAGKALSVSLVAEMAGRVIGHIAFSPVAISNGARDWYGLGPVSVLPEYQRRGIGRALIREGLTRLMGMHARGCCLVGHPEYYKKLGFDNVPQLILEGVPPEVFLALSFDGSVPQGTVAFHEGFKADRQP